jgi:hypothetical protein
MVVKTQSHIGVSIYLFAGLLALFTSLAKGDLMDADKAEALARKAFSDKYLEFTGDKNVMGKAMSVDGKVQQTGSKSRFDNDDGISYKSDLTYHDLVFPTEDEANNQKNKDNKTGNSNGSNRYIQPFVSPHGGLSEAGGSSILERTMYQEFDKFSKQEEKEDPNKQQEQKGVQQKGVFKITTKEIFEDPKSQQNSDPSKSQSSNGGKPNTPPQDNKKKEKEKVERLELRDEVKQAVEKVGSDSAETVIQAARDKDKKDDPNALPNELLLYDAAAKATTSLWNATMANLYQRRIFKGLPDNPRPKLSEETPDCASWEKKRLEELGKLSPQEREAEQKNFELTKKGCEQMSKMPFNAINPGYEVDPNNPKVEVLKERGPEKEDAFARDMRVQLELMSAAGKSINDVQRNWKYDPDDEKVDIKTEDGSTIKQNMAEQLEDYNQKLQEAQAGYDNVKSEAPDIFKSNVDASKYQIEPGTRSLMEINQRPAQGFGDFGVDPSKLADPAEAQNYNELIKNVK